MNLFNLFKKNKVEHLLKSEAAAASEPTEDLNVVEAFDNAIEGLQKAKTKKKDEETEPENESEEPEGESEEPEGEPEEPEEPEEDEPRKKGKMKKSSVPEEIAQTPEAGKAMDVEPFLKSLAVAIENRFVALEKSYASEITSLKSILSDIKKVQDNQSTFMVAEGKMLKSIAGMAVEELNTPVERKGAVSTQERFAKSSVEGAEEMTVAQAKEKLITLAKSRQLQPHQVSLIEGRLNKGQELPSYFIDLCKNLKGGNQ